MENQEKQKPYLTVRDRSLSISIFKKHVKDLSTNKEYDKYGACLQRSYQVKDSNEWKNERINLFPDEILNVGVLCARAYNDLTVKIQQDREANKGNGANSFPAQTMDSPEPPAYIDESDVPF